MIMRQRQAYTDVAGVDEHLANVSSKIGARRPVSQAATPSEAM